MDDAAVGHALHGAAASTVTGAAWRAAAAGAKAASRTRIFA